MMADANGGALVDEAELRNQTFDDPALLAEIVGLFVQQTPALLAALEAASGRARAEVAHRLKGSALALGAGPLAAQASLIEEKPEADELIAEAGRLAAATVSALKEMVARS